ncbi:MAG: rubrerythrin family protein, partial [Acidimicrobiia bacterium]
MPTDVQRYKSNFNDEINAAYLYRVAADLEEDSTISGVYERLADVEDRHANLWEGKLKEAGAPVPTRDPSVRSRILAWLARRMGPSVLAQVMASTEMSGRTMYDSQPEAAGTSLPADERSHAVMLDA